ncbi:MAG TPA: biotin transporter BioY [Alphaproteobacteria bacterium]|nr:biotin transporter BioY [Alphaproteobacteria bacterium]
MATTSEAHPTLIGTLWPAGTRPMLRWVLLMLLGSLFLALCAQINVPSELVPITMQTFGVLLIGMTFGARLGAATVALYLFEGALGLPVYAQFRGGLPVLFGPTGGYLFGFVIAAWLVGALAERGWDRNVFTTALAMLLGNIVLYVPGLIVLGAFIGGELAITEGLVKFVVGDLLKLALAAVLLPSAWVLLRRI